MTTEFMQVTLSQQPADARWGEKALLSTNGEGMTIHLTGADKLGAIQRAGRKIDGQGIKNVKLAGDGWDLENSWAFWQGYRGPKGQRNVEWAELPEAARQELDKRLKIVDWVRDTINMPAEELGPEQLATRAVDLMCDVGCDAVSYRITKGEDLREQNYAGIHTVGRGSERPPVLLALDFNPTGNPDAPVFACLVGKGITFDTGGYSLKQSAFMDSMKADMGGAATITGALALAAARGLKQRVKLYLCCADNMVSGNAFKLGDIIRYRNGKTVEVMNTDAEGRLVLADGLIDASEQNPQLIIDCATPDRRGQNRGRQRLPCAVQLRRRAGAGAAEQRRRRARAVLASAAGRVPPQPAAVQLRRAEQRGRPGLHRRRQHRGGLPVALRQELPARLAAHRLFRHLPQRRGGAVVGRRDRFGRAYPGQSAAEQSQIIERPPRRALECALSSGPSMLGLAI